MQQGTSMTVHRYMAALIWQGGITHSVKQLLTTACPPEQAAFALGRVAT
jgi:hypothetical protein